MKKLTRLIFASTLGASALITHASIGFLNIDSLGLTTLSDDEMSSLRGGFVSINDNIINIGLSVTTEVNGETVLNTHVADFTISNGILTSHDGTRTYDYSDPLKIISVGENNIINTSATQDAIGFVVQNSADNTAIKTETVLDIEADIQGFNRQNLFNNRLEHAILHNGY
ncbi:hypothetical protein C9J03_09210 [Photobacterium gaetbulicola]|uniref:Uncharacterized protein n=2 Tax=Photobacterium gaetbulicola TaxID=1295392 RepID=A0A0C5W214_9GAMM|nr:hypothetical protein [Photobacterium gaetbulicola]AJR05416.1 hypothetical protein H744_1c0391 [Photobacterium gaetbulicola Gung47]KHT62339.1 hypothetical protein RJ45_18375 [Photobacterium gaetbulicola]PSU12740.1 hypothetical protein C9J03_09210 [Photobacterium gaetbulicola]